MKLKTNAPIVMRHRGAIHFGTLVWVERGRAGVISESELRVGDFLSVRIEIDTWDQSVLAIAEVRRADRRSNGLHRYVIHLLEMRRSERERFESWVDELRVAAGVDEEEAPPVLDSEIGSNVPEDVARTVPVPGAPMDEPSPGWDLESTPSVSVSVEYRTSRRQALRAVLRAACGEDASAERDAGDAGAPPPHVRVNDHASPIEVELRYPSSRSWAADWESWLFQGLAFVRHEGTQPDLEQELRVRLFLADRIDISCPGRVVVQHTTGFGVILDLDPHLLEGMAQVAGESANDGKPGARFDARHEASSPRGVSFWRRLFRLQGAEDTLDRALSQLPDPLGSLELDPPVWRELISILERTNTHYLVIADDVRTLLREHRWSWPELEDRIRDSEHPLALAANHIVLAYSVRKEAVQTLKGAETATRITPTQVEVVAERVESCPRCAQHQGQPTDPLTLAKRGLPPFHLGCTCRVARTLVTPESRSVGNFPRRFR
jgi:hypothetical protein